MHVRKLNPFYYGVFESEDSKRPCITFIIVGGQIIIIRGWKMLTVKEIQQLPLRG